jgi:uncharacterized protein (DUF58 family)
VITQQVRKKFNRYWERWVKKRNRLGDPQTVHSRNLYILPSGFGWAYGIVVVTLFFGAINYQISTMFLMTFILAIMGLISAWEAHGNLKNLSFQFISIDDAQQETPAKITLLIEANNKIRFGVDFQIALQAKIRLEKIPPEGLQFVIPIETAARGYFQLPPITISGHFPFGIFGVWSYVYFDEHYYVYPKSVNPGFWPNPCSDQNIKMKHAPGDEEFYDLKQVENPWAVPNLIAWKIAAKGQGWYLKTMDSNEVDYWLFKLNDLPTKDLELKLQYLSYWLQTAELNNQIYALELTASPTEFSHGKTHLQHCLRQLALYQ